VALRMAYRQPFRLVQLLRTGGARCDGDDSEEGDARMRHPQRRGRRPDSCIPHSLGPEIPSEECRRVRRAATHSGRDAGGAAVKLRRRSTNGRQEQAEVVAAACRSSPSHIYVPVAHPLRNVLRADPGTGRRSGATNPHNYRLQDQALCHLPRYLALLAEPLAQQLVDGASRPILPRLHEVRLLPNTVRDRWPTACDSLWAGRCLHR